MSGGSSQIPNLLSLRGGGGSSRAAQRSRGRGGRAGGSSSRLTQDQTVQGTDDDAATSRLSAVGLGYLDDVFAKNFVESPMGTPARRLPIINRGTYTRTFALDHLVQRFLDAGSPVGTPQGHDVRQRQIISLGAGTDTRFFRLLSTKSHPNLVYHELDFPVTVRKKARIIETSPSLRQLLGGQVWSQDGSWSCQPPSGGEYFCHAVDLRDIGQQNTSFPLLQGLRPNLPTLLISECCLCYLDTAVGSAVLGWFAGQIATLATVIYEPIRPDDVFGRMMVSNLAQRGIRLPTLESFPSPLHQEARLRDAGLENAKALTIKQIWDTWISHEEKERVNSLEGLDEVEEWQLLADHYVVAWGWRGPDLGL